MAKVALLKKKVNQSSLTKHTLLFVVCEIGSFITTLKVLLHFVSHTHTQRDTQSNRKRSSVTAAHEECEKRKKNHERDGKREPVGAW